MSSIPSLENLVHELTRLPGIGEKTAQRLAYYILRSRPDFTSRLADALKSVEEKIQYCTDCFAYTEQAQCRICGDGMRSHETLCVVEEPFDILKVEGAGSYRGRYHVLHGALSPLEGIGPDELKINELVARITASAESDKPIREVILALDADLEGDTTSLYLSKLLSNKGIRVTRLAYGMPFGSDLDYIDPRTLGRAIENRVEL